MLRAQANFELDLLPPRPPPLELGKIAKLSIELEKINCYKFIDKDIGLGLEVFFFFNYSQFNGYAM
jgi:hypothetical protein